jgi:hypothetical protein
MLVNGVATTTITHDLYPTPSTHKYLSSSGVVINTMTVSVPQAAILSRFCHPKSQFCTKNKLYLLFKTQFNREYQDKS